MQPPEKKDAPSSSGDGSVPAVPPTEDAGVVWTDPAEIAIVVNASLVTLILR
jgi:hypothetical protein